MHSQSKSACFDTLTYQGEKNVGNRLLKKLKEDDVLYIKSIGRLGRNYNEVLERWRIPTKEMQVEMQEDIVIIDMPLLDTRQGKDPVGTFIKMVNWMRLQLVRNSYKFKLRVRGRYREIRNIIVFA